MPQLYDAFISYGRADSKEFAAKLCQSLSERGYRIWLDLNDIPLGVDYQQQIDADLERSHNFVFLMSPHAVNSPYCRLEIERAVAMHKRIIPLLHVEEISRATWQARHPFETDEDWAAYQAQNRQFGDVRNPRLHPILGKLNWIYGRKEDDLNTAFVGLAEVFERHRSYVHAHTQILVRALQWTAQQRRSQFLLVGKAREQAEAWLKVRFNEQPPCTPTDLHAEYITESVKNANNLMSQVFLAHAEADAAVTDKVRRSLQRQGITVWTSANDIQTGEAFQRAIDQGIEQADNVVYLLSPESIQSDYCQHELDYALALHKRIIPILVRPTAVSDQPPGLKDLQYIDLTDNERDEDYQLDESQLLKILKTDAAYYQTHKRLTTKALKWQRQHRNPSTLLRGYNLRQSETWLKTAKKRPAHCPTPLQEAFIQESLRQPPPAALDVFISYSRSDSDLARKLNDRLQIYGKLTWFDQESIAAASADFQQEIYRGIEACDNFLFILSPQSITSPYCAGEVEYAAKLNKRFVTLLYRPVKSGALHPELAKVQWIEFTRRDDFWDSFNRLVRVLETDREHVHQHTRWAQRAIEWDQKRRSEDLLLRGSEFAIAQDWFQAASTQKKQPAPTSLHQDYIYVSKDVIEAQKRREKRQQQRLKMLLGAVSVALVAALGAGAFALKQTHSAVKSEIEALTQASQASFTVNPDTFDALLQALEAGTRLKQTIFLKHDPVLRAKVMTALAQANYWVKERDRLEGHGDYVQAVSFSPDGSWIATASNDDTVKLWEQDGRLRQTLRGHLDQVKSVSVSPNGELLASASNDATVKLWTPAGDEVMTLTDADDRLNDVAFSPNGQMLAAVDSGGTAWLWSTLGDLLTVLRGHEVRASGVSFSPNSQTIATASFDNTVKLWTLDGQLLHTFAGHQGNVFDVEFSPDGTTLASSSADQSAILWDVGRRIKRQTLPHQGLIRGIQFSPDGRTVATASDDEIVNLWTLEGRNIMTLRGHRGRLSQIDFSPDGRMLASAGLDKTVKLWQLQSPLLVAVEQAHDGAIYGVAISPDGLIATASEDGTAKLWDQEGNLLQTIVGHLDGVNSVHFSPDGQQILTASSDTTARLWRRDGQAIATLRGHTDQVISAQFSPDGQTIGTVSFDQTIKLWSQDGRLIRTLPAHEDGANGISFGPDGQTIAIAGEDGTTRLWTLDGSSRQSLVGHAGPVYWATFSADGAIATTSEDNTVKLWTAAGDETVSLISHTAGVWGASFSPDGQMVATASDDNTVKLWHRDGTLIATLNGHQLPVNNVAFGPDGRMLASIDSGGQLLIWNVDSVTLDGLLAYGCGWIANYLNTNSNAPSGLCQGVAIANVPEGNESSSLEEKR